MKAYIKHAVIATKLYKGLKSNSRFSVFLVCLLIAVVCWIFTSLNKTYTGNFTYRINFSNVPFHKNITNELPAFISIGLEAKGFELIAYSFRQKLETIDVDIAAQINQAQVPGKNIVVSVRSLITNKLPGINNGIIIKQLNPEYINFDFSQKYRKKIPVKADVEVGYKKQYFSTLGFIVSPDSVEIAGSKEDIEKISEISTQSMRLSGVDHKTILPLKIKNNLKGIEVNPSSVWIFLPVSELAEEVIKVPVEISGSKNNDGLMLPDKVSIIYQAPLHLIDQINAESFRVCLDPQADISSGKAFRLVICNAPPGVYNARIEPGFVNYLT